MMSPLAASGAASFQSTRKKCPRDASSGLSAKRRSKAAAIHRTDSNVDAIEALELRPKLVSVLGPGLKLALRLLAALARATPAQEIELTIISERHRKRMIILNEIGMLAKCVPL